MKALAKSSCPCCETSLVTEYDICPVCGWENDPIQLAQPDYSGGANKMSLNEAKRVYAEGEKIE